MASCKLGFCFLSVGLTMYAPDLLYAVNIQCLFIVVKREKYFGVPGELRSIQLQRIIFLAHV
jgi:hypothetical protein